MDSSIMKLSPSRSAPNGNNPALFWLLPEARWKSPAVRTINPKTGKVLGEDDK